MLNVSVGMMAPDVFEYQLAHSIVFSRSMSIASMVFDGRPDCRFNVLDDLCCSFLIEHLVSVHLRGRIQAMYFPMCYCY